jgi:hypothetical protein
VEVCGLVTELIQLAWGSQSDKWPSPSFSAHEKRGGNLKHCLWCPKLESIFRYPQRIIKSIKIENASLIKILIQNFGCIEHEPHTVFT